MKPYIAVYISNNKEIPWDFKLVLHNADIKKGDQCIRIKTGEKCICEEVSSDENTRDIGRPYGWFKTESGEMFDAIFGTQVIKGQSIKISEKAKKFVKENDSFDESEIKIINCCIKCGNPETVNHVIGCTNNNIPTYEPIAFIKCDKCETFH